MAGNLQLNTVTTQGMERLVYVHVFGDNWRHNLIAEDIRDSEPDVE